MSSRRKTDPKTRPRFRSERFVEEGGKWFFYTREGTLVGPCEDMLDASIRLEKYLRVIDSGLLPEDRVIAQANWAKQAG